MTKPDLGHTRAFVTGASRGIGRAVALALAEHGAGVALNARSKEDLEDVAAEVRSIGVAAAVCPADVTDREAARAAVRTAERELGNIDLLVANAGVANPPATVWEADPEAWWHVMRVNVLGALHVVQAIVPGMMERDRGRVVHVASYVGIRPNRQASAYSCSKAALMRLNDNLAADLEGTNVASFAMSPGMVRTDMTRELIEDLGLADSQITPIEQGAQLIVRLASGEADALTGRMIHVSDDLDSMIAAADEIQKRNWYQLRLVRGLLDTDPA